MHLGALPPAFAGLDSADSQEAASFLQPFALEASDILMEQGEEDYTLAFIVQGSVSFLDQGTRIGGAASRDMIGEVELFGQIPRCATVEASAVTHLLVLAYEHWLELCERGNPAVFNVERFSHRRMADRMRWFAEGIAERSMGGHPTPRDAPRRSGGLRSALSNLFGGGRSPNVSAAAVLQASPSFGWADGALLDEIAAEFQIERFDPGTIVCHQGELGAKAYVIADGQVDVEVGVSPSTSETIAALGPGAAFGDTTIAQNAPRPVACVAKSEVVALSIHRDRYGSLYAANTPAGSVFRQGMLRNLVNQLLTAQQRYVDLDRDYAARVEESMRTSPVNNVWRD